MADLTIRQAAAQAGVSIDVIYGAITRGDLAAYKPTGGRQYRVTAAAFNAWRGVAVLDGGPLTEADLRRIVREELAAFFSRLGGGA
jgi:excisionase family DNA binding protein